MKTVFKYRMISKYETNIFNNILDLEKYVITVEMDASNRNMNNTLNYMM